MVNSCSDTRPGRKAGHKGISHQFKPSQTVEHTVHCCQCGSCDLRFFSQQQRIIVDIPKPQPYTVTLHRINHYLCTACNTMIKPAVDMPEHGMLGKNLLGITTTLGSQCRLPPRRISDVFEILYGLKILPACINNSLVSLRIIAKVCR
jgi:transposase